MTLQAIVGSIAVAACAVVAIAILRSFGSNDNAAGNTLDPSFIADPNNTTTVSVRGWSRTELDRILADFARGYGLEKDLVFAISEKARDAFTISFPRDIKPTLLLFLVNYVQYPKDFDLAHRSIGVLGRVVATAAFDVRDSALIGKQAAIYVPANDVEYDEVYARVESGRAYRISFRNMRWKPVDDARMPATVAGL